MKALELADTLETAGIDAAIDAAMKGTHEQRQVRSLARGDVGAAERPGMSTQNQTQPEALKLAATLRALDTRSFWTNRKLTQAADEMERLNARMQELEQAAQAVVDRWDSADWKDLPATAGYIQRLRLALAAAPQPNP